MRKKLMIPALLLGMIFLGSCVKETESQSVTDIRDAKAEQLKARADLNNAAAEATKIAAAADVALMEAEAQAKAANTALYKAQTETLKKQRELTLLRIEEKKLQNEAQKIANKRAQFELEKALYNLDMTKKAAELELARIAEELKVMQAENEALLAWAQAAVVEAQKDLIEYETGLVEAADEAEREALEDRLEAIDETSEDYITELGKLNTAQQDLLEAKARLVELEEELANAPALRDEMIVDYNNIINKNKATIEMYKGFYKYTEDIEGLEDEYSTLSYTKDLLYAQYLEKYDIENKVVVDLEPVNEAEAAVMENAFYMFVNNYILLPAVEDEDGTLLYPAFTTSDLDSYRTAIVGVTLPAEPDWDNLPEDFDYWTWQEEYWAAASEGYYMESQQPTGYNQKVDKNYEIVLGENLTETKAFGDSLSYVLWPATDPVEKVELRAKQLIDSIKVIYVEPSAETLADLSADYNGKAAGYYKTPGGEYVKYSTSAKNKYNAVERVAAAKEDYEEDPSDADLKQAYLDAIEVEAWLADEVAAAETIAKDYERLLDAAETYLDYYTNQKTYFDELQKLMDTRNEASVTAYAELVAAYTDRRIAENAKDDAVLAYNAAAEILGSENTYASAAWLDKQIADLEKNIAEKEGWIEQLKAADDSDVKALIELQKLVIESCEVAVAAAQARVDILKEELDALLK